MINFALIFVCISVGILIRRFNILSADAYKPINTGLIFVALPALGLRFVPEINGTFSSLIPALSPPIIWIFAGIFVFIYSKFIIISKEIRISMLICLGLCNSAFLGFPMVSAYFGEENLYNAIVFDQVTFLMFSVLVVPLVLRTTSDKSSSNAMIFKRILTFPSFLATISALVVSQLIDYSVIYPLLDKILATLSPLALFSIGLQLRISEGRLEKRELFGGLSYKLLIAPLFIYLFVAILGDKTIIGEISVIQSAMPTHITSSLIAIQYGLNPRFCYLMVGIGILFCFITSAFGYFIM